MCIPIGMFDDDLDDSVTQSETSYAESKDEASDPLATPLEDDQIEYPKVCFPPYFLSTKPYALLQEKYCCFRCHSRHRVKITFAFKNNGSAL